jgi:hypothetical protein
MFIAVVELFYLSHQHLSRLAVGYVVGHSVAAADRASLSKDVMHVYQ